MQKKYLALFALLIISVLFSALFIDFDNLNKDYLLEKLNIQKPEGIMFLIEYKDVIGLSNFVNEMEQRQIHGLLMVTPEFVQQNCEDIKEIIKYNVEIVACNVDAPLWDISYEEQKTRIIEMKKNIESCTNVPVRIISSRYFASDMNTIKVADELGIPYVTARGTTDTKATIYQPENYNVKILSVSNIPKVDFKYGSMCDYSYFERSGTPDDMKEELLRAIEPLTQKEKERYGSNHKITPVSHTNIGGYLEPWMNMWLEFWDSKKVEWVDLDEFMKEPDWILPLWQIPINKNAPYTEEKIKPIVSYEDEEKVFNPCAVTDIGSNVLMQEQEIVSVEDKIMVFHNGKGSMCLDFLSFIKTIDYPVQEFLDYEDSFIEELNEQMSEFSKSEGVSKDFSYFPIIFINDRAFSGFNEQIKQELLNEIAR